MYNALRRALLPLLLSWSLLCVEVSASGLMPGLQDIRDRGRLVVAMHSADVAPFFYRDETGELQGIDVDIARAIAASLGVVVEFDRSAGSFDEVIERVVLRRADLGISMLSVTSERAQRVLFSTPYARIRRAVLVRRLFLARQYRLSPEQALKQAKRLGVQTGTSYDDEVIRFFPGVALAPLESLADMETALRTDAIDALFASEVTCQRVLHDMPGLQFTHRLVLLPGQTDAFACAVPWQEVFMWKWLNACLGLLAAPVIPGGVLRPASPETQVRGLDLRLFNRQPTAGDYRP